MWHPDKKTHAKDLTIAATSLIHSLGNTGTCCALYEYERVYDVVMFNRDDIWDTRLAKLPQEQL